MTRRRRHWLLLPALYAAAQLPAHATNGDQMLGTNATQWGMAGAVIAAPQDSATLFYNPAGLTQLGMEEVRFDMGAGLLNPPREVNGIESDSIKPYVRATAQLYRAAAERTVRAIDTYLNLPCLVPQGGLYTVVRTGVESSEFTRRVLEKTGVIVVPGWGFGETLKYAVRLSYGPLVRNLDKIDEAMQRIGTFLKTQG